MDYLVGLADAQRQWQNHLAMAKKGGLPSVCAKHQALTEDGIGAQQHTALPSTKMASGAVYNTLFVACACPADTDMTYAPSAMSVNPHPSE